MARCIPKEDTFLTNASDYVKNLGVEALSRYRAKLVIGRHQICDPYAIPVADWKDQPSLWPDVCHGDIWQYLVNKEGIYTQEKLKAYKSLEAWQYFVAGHVKIVFYNNLNDESKVCLVKCSVTPSQRLRETAHKVWVAIMKDNGEIICAHCTCMAGLGEVCSHVAALLFKITAAVNLGITRQSSTQEACKWNNSFQREVNPRAVAEFPDLAMRNRRKPVHTVKFTSNRTTPPIEELRKLKLACPDAAFFTMIPNLDEEDTDSATESENDEDEISVELPSLLPLLYDDKYSFLDLQLLEKEAKIIMTNLKENPEAINNLEASTRQQSNCNMWYRYRRGRITASKSHRIYQLKDTTSPNSLLKSIMGYSDESRISKVKAVKWGIDHEDHAREEYVKLMSSNHINFTCRRVGFVLSESKPFIGASSDAIASCDCHGSRVVEIKCPYKHRDVNPLDAAKLDPKFCLTADGLLKQNHEYYSQIHIQMFCNQIYMADFVVYTNVSTHINQIEFNQEFTNRLINKCSSFFLKFVLPEILTKKLKHALDDEMQTSSDQSDNLNTN